MDDLKPLKYGIKAAGAHVLEKGYQLRQKYGNFISFNILLEILRDDKFALFPACIEFNSQKIDKGDVWGC